MTLILRYFTEFPICNVKQCTALESVVFDESRVIAAINKLKKIIYLLDQMLFHLCFSNITNTA